MTGDSGAAWDMAINGAITGVITAGVFSGIRGFRAARALGKNPWTGNPKITRSVGAAHKGFSNVKIPKGFKETKQFGYPHGQKVYKYKSLYYSRDFDGHNGGIWKVFEESGGRLKRIGTTDESLSIFKK
jgi:hypothetical protein